MIVGKQSLQTKSHLDGTDVALTYYPVLFRTYSRRLEDGSRENFDRICDRVVEGLKEIGHLSPSEIQKVENQLRNKKAAFPAGRVLWVAGTDWVRDPKNYHGLYNCTSTNVVDLDSFGYLMELAMQGCGTGAVLEPHAISKLPKVLNFLNISVQGEFGTIPSGQRYEKTVLQRDGRNKLHLTVGDSREGWCQAYQKILEIACDRSHFERFGDYGNYEVVVDIHHIRPAGEPLKGFGGVANPGKLPNLFYRCAKILNQAVGRKLTEQECCLLIDEAALVVVAGNVRRSAGLRQFSSDSPLYKMNLWQQGEDGNWRIDPQRDALRMANHTRVYHRKPSQEECIEAVRKQFYSGEGAIQYAPEAIARGNADLLHFSERKNHFIELYSEQGSEAALSFLDEIKPEMSEGERYHRMQRYALNPCAEVIGNDFHCNLGEVHLNQIDPNNEQAQKEAFEAASISVAALLYQKFAIPRYQRSREWDPIVGVSFTGLFDFFVHAFGVDWLRWWEAGRPETAQGLDYKRKEREYLQWWRQIVETTVSQFCGRHGLKKPNRCTTVQPAGTKSLLTGASPGWHPPKAARFIRRITFRRDDPVAIACYRYGYNVVPSQSDRDDEGNLLNDPFDPRCTEWLVEIPVEVSWASLPGADKIAIERFSALAQFDFAMAVQRNYVTHNTSATIELRENEIEPLGTAIWKAIQEGDYISFALLPRFDSYQNYPRLPFEPITKQKIEEEKRKIAQRQETNNFEDLMHEEDRKRGFIEESPKSCEGQKCEIPSTG